MMELDEILEERALLVEKLVEQEWELFDKVQGMDGRAPCQEDKETFTLLRTSQFLTWENPMIRSYMLDMQGASLNHRNIVAEKYAHMMKDTDPEHYAALSHQLPKLSSEQLEAIEVIVATQLGEIKVLSHLYPRFVASGRALEGKDDVPDNASYESYLRGELSSYGYNTVKLYLAWVERNQAQGIDTAKLFLESVARQYGYLDLASAEESLGA